MLRKWLVGRREFEALQRRVEVLEQSRRRQPVIAVQFEPNGATPDVLLHVRNEGPSAAVFTAALAIDGQLAEPLRRPVYACWAGSDQPEMRLDALQVGTLTLATLETMHWPLVRWAIHYTEQGQGRGKALAEHTSLIGGNPEHHAPRLVLDVVITSRPALADTLRRIHVALDPFSAEQVRPLDVSGSVPRAVLPVEDGR